MQNTFKITPNPNITQDLLDLINGFNAHLQETINCNLTEYSLETDLTEYDQETDITLEYCIHTFYIHSNGEVLIHKPVQATYNYFDCNGIDSMPYGAAYPDGELIKNNTMIIKLKVYA